MGFEEIQHTADLAIRVWADSYPKLLEEAALGMFALMGQARSLDRTRVVVANGEDAEDLLVGWLNELLYISKRYGEIYSQFAVEIPAQGELLATVRGGALPSQTQRYLVKAATYHGLVVRQQGGLYEAEIIFDT